MSVFHLLFLFLFQCGDAFLKHSTSRLVQSSTDLMLAKVEEDGCQTPMSSGLAGRRKLQYITACKSWKELKKKGTNCPKPTACECHCDCPETTATGEEAKPPPACPIYPAFPTLPPPPAAKVTTTPKPDQKHTDPAKCALGEVLMSDGTCQMLDMTLINRVVEMVNEKRAILEKVQKEYNGLHHVDCDSCPGSKEYYAMRPKLIDAHKGYRSGLGFLLNAIAAMEEAARLRGLKDDGVYTGPEFVLGKKKLRPHCEPWTVLRGQKPSDTLCAVVCRNEPSCKGFAKDPENGWCVWFDDAKPKTMHGEEKDVCSSVEETKFIKMKPGPQSKVLWENVAKIHVFDKAMIEALTLAEPDANTTHLKFIDWWGYDNSNSTIQLALKDVFLGHMDNYTATILDVIALRKQWLLLQEAAISLATHEGNERPPLNDDQKEKIFIPLITTPAPVGLQEPEEDLPKPLHWADFPNSQDTRWSQIHPDCPMGAPCVCDCKCRGPPPQNFVEPPLVPVACPPPPPLPNPAVLTAILNR